MESKIAAFTFLTFSLITVSTTRIALDPPAADPSVVRIDDASKLIKTSAGSVADAQSNILLPGEKAKSDSDETTADNRLPEPEKPTNDLTQRPNFARFHPINRHFLGKPPRDPKQIGTHRRPCRKSVTPYRIPRTQTSDKNDVITSGRTDSATPETFRGQVPSNWLKVKHHYESRRHHNHHHRNNNDEGIKTKHVFDREKLKDLIRQHKEKKREEEAGFMKSIRKFLKHTFD